MDKIIEKLRARRDAAARNFVLFETDIGRAVQRGQAYAYNDALKLLGVDDGAVDTIVAQERADVKSVRGY